MAKKTFNIYKTVDKDDVFVERMIDLNRRTKVGKSGRVFNFSALVVVGNGKGKIGIARGKAREATLAIKRGFEKAKRKLFFIKTNGDTVFHKIFSKFGATKIVILPASKGTGVISSCVLKPIFTAIGIKDVFAKCFGSKNHNNIINCVIKAFDEMIKNVESNSIRRSFLTKKNK